MTVLNDSIIIYGGYGRINGEAYNDAHSMNINEMLTDKVCKWKQIDLLSEGVFGHLFISYNK